MKIGQGRRSRWLFAVAAAGTLAVGALGFGSAAGAVPNVEHFVITGSGDTANFVAYGAFSGGGVDVQRNSSDVLKFGPGRLIIQHPNSAANFSYSANANNCHETIVGTGSYTLANGTGDYAGITGSGTYHFRGDAVAPRNPDGSCNFNAEPASDVFKIKAHGPVSLGDI